jgi:hypothetical protein
MFWIIALLLVWTVAIVHNEVLLRAGRRNMGISGLVKYHANRRDFRSALLLVVLLLVLSPLGALLQAHRLATENRYWSTLSRGLSESDIGKYLGKVFRHWLIVTATWIIGAAMWVGVWTSPTDPALWALGAFCPFIPFVIPLFENWDDEQ